MFHEMTAGRRLTHGKCWWQWWWCHTTALTAEPVTHADVSPCTALCLLRGPLFLFFPNCSSVYISYHTWFFTNFPTELLTIRVSVSFNKSDNLSIPRYFPLEMSPPETSVLETPSALMRPGFAAAVVPFAPSQEFPLPLSCRFRWILCCLLSWITITFCWNTSFGIFLRKNGNEPDALIWCLWTEFYFWLKAWWGLRGKLKVNLSHKPGKHSSSLVAKQHKQGDESLP